MDKKYLITLNEETRNKLLEIQKNQIIGSETGLVRYFATKGIEQEYKKMKRA